MSKHTLKLGDYIAEIEINDANNGLTFEVSDTISTDTEYTGNINYSGCIHIYTDCLHLCEPEDLQRVQDELTELRNFWRTNCKNAIL